MRRSDTTFSTHDLRAEGNVALREGHSKTAGLGTQMQPLTFLCSGVGNYRELMESRFSGLLCFYCPTGASQRTRLVDLSSVQNLNFLKMTRFCLLSSPKADVKLQGSVQHFVSVEYALGRFELVMRACALQTVIFNLCCGSECWMHFKEEQETQGSYDIKN